MPLVVGPEAELLGKSDSIASYVVADGKLPGKASRLDNMRQVLTGEGADRLERLHRVLAKVFVADP